MRGLSHVDAESIGSPITHVPLWGVSEMIATVHQGVITVKIKCDQTAPEAFDEDLTDAFSRHFITRDTWLHLSAPSTIE